MVLRPLLLSATLTPFDAAFRPDPERAIPYYRQLLDRGLDGLNVLGTTGEAFSTSVEDRVGFMRAVAGAVDPARMFVGTGAAALHDAVTLTAEAFRLGFSAALVMPPFYYRDAGSRGYLAFFRALFENTSPPPRSVLLYNFPRMSGMTFDRELTGMLLEAFPQTIRGMKESGNDRALQAELHAAFPSLEIYPGSETDLLATRDAGLHGCISGSVALWPERARRVWESGDAAEDERLTADRAALGRGLIPAVRARVAAELRDDAWLRSVPPL